MSRLRSVIHSLLFVCAATCCLAAPTAPPVVDHVRYFPAKGGEQVMAGGVFSGSNVSPTEGFVDLTVIKTAPSADQWSEIPLENKKVYRWLRYLGPTGSQDKAGKIEFYAGSQLLTENDKVITNGPFPLPEAPDRQYAVLDMKEAATARRVAFNPGRGDQDKPFDLALVSNPGAVIRYTLDGSWPTAAHGETYKSPIHIDKITTVQAIAILDGGAPSIPSVATYLLPSSSKPGLSSVHIGNSLTGTTGSFPRYARTAGYNHAYTAFLRGGALTRELWALADGSFASDSKAAAKEKTALERGTQTWTDFFNKVPRVDIVTVQPRDFDLEKEVASEIQFFNVFRQKSPDLQPWLYCEWVEMKRERPSDKGEVPSSQMKKLYPALTWEESMSAMLLYVEELQKMLGEKYHEGKRPRVLPAALAMGWIKNMIDHNRLPGIKPGSFYPLLFHDQVHPANSAFAGTANGGFLVDMTWYSAFYRESSEGKVLPIETTFTPEQVATVQRLAWDVIKNYPDCGLYEEGKEPCGYPEFSVEKITGEVKQINLHSTTPGAWFRYTLDGTPPARTNGYVYCGVISFRPGMELKAIAYKSGMADSSVAAMNPLVSK